MSKLLRIRRYTDTKGLEHHELRLLGLKVRIPVLNRQIFRYFSKKWQAKQQKRTHKKYIKSALPEFLRLKRGYLAQKEKDVIRRLFITSGNLQLINALAIIKHLKETDEKPVENHLLIWSHITNDDFEEVNSEIARTFGIDHYYTCCGLDKTALNISCYLIDHKLHDIDEVYGLRYVGHLEVYHRLYQGCEYIVTDESFFSLVPSPNLLKIRCKKFITNCYLGKMDYVDYPRRTWQVQHPKSQYFEEIARLSSEMYPWPQVMTPGSKVILFCATFPAAWDAYTSERQQLVINRLLECGYHILYKPHPRDPMLPTESERLKILNTRLPLECYRPRDVLAVVSLYSSASTQSYHYCGIPGFIDYEACRVSDAEHICVLQEEYTPSYEALLELDVCNLTFDELKQQIEQIYKAHIKDTPMLSQNKRFTQAFLKALKNKHLK